MFLPDSSHCSENISHSNFYLNSRILIYIALEKNTHIAHDKQNPVHVL